MRKRLQAQEMQYPEGRRYRAWCVVLRLTQHLVKFVQRRCLEARAGDMHRVNASYSRIR